MSTYTLGQLSQPYKVGPDGANRDILSSLFNQNNIAKEDWIRGEQSADLALQRALYQQQSANDFNASEAQKQRDFTERMSRNAYQYAVEDMKKAGINPIYAYYQGGSQMPTASGATSTVTEGAQGGRLSGPTAGDSGIAIAHGINATANLIKVVAGLITKKPVFGFGKN